MKSFLYIILLFPVLVFGQATGKGTFKLPVNNPTGYTCGDIWSDSTRMAVATCQDSAKSILSSLIWMQTDLDSIVNTTSEGSMFFDGVGTKTLPGSFLTTGKGIRINMKGYISCNGTPTNIIRLKLDGYTVLESTGTLPAGLTDAYVRAQFDLVCFSTGTTGKVMCAGETFIATSTGIVTASMRGFKGVLNTVNTEQRNLIDLTYKWGTAHADNNLRVTNLTIEVLN